jgi:hypothetical protein
MPIGMQSHRGHEILRRLGRMCEIGCLVTTGASTVVGTSMDAYILFFSICTQHASCLYPRPFAVLCTTSHALILGTMYVPASLLQACGTLSRTVVGRRHAHTPSFRRCRGWVGAVQRVCAAARAPERVPCPRGSGLPRREHRSIRGGGAIAAARCPRG